MAEKSGNATLIPGRCLKLHRGFKLAATDEHHRHLRIRHDLVSGVIRHIPFSLAVGDQANHVNQVIPGVRDNFTGRHAFDADPVGVYPLGLESWPACERKLSQIPFPRWGPT